MIIFFLCYGALTCAAPGCIDNSWHMSKPFDNKEYHIVSSQFGAENSHCQCSCRKVSHDRGYCYECGHYRDLQPWVIVRNRKACAQ